MLWLANILPVSDAASRCVFATCLLDAQNMHILFIIENLISQ
jgi:hypothetical protein